jgi:drug/metabolite transporter (DMT)-like permease
VRVKRIAYLLFAVGSLLVVLGVLLVAGAGGDNGERARTVEVAGHATTTYRAGAVTLALAAVVLVTATAAWRRSS